MSAGGSTSNVAVVMQVIEKLPVVATAATRLSSPKVFSAAAKVAALNPLLARISLATAKQVFSRASARAGVFRALMASIVGWSIPTLRDALHLGVPRIFRAPEAGDREIDHLLLAARQRPR